MDSIFCNSRFCSTTDENNLVLIRTKINKPHWSLSYYSLYNYNCYNYYNNLINNYNLINYIKKLGLKSLLRFFFEKSAFNL